MGNVSSVGATSAAFVEEPTVVGAGSDWPLQGKVTLPVEAGAVPGVVLVHGGGPGDMDQSVGPNKPFRDLGHGLAERGVATLRYDKRAHVHREANAMDPTVRGAIVDDAVAAVRILQDHPRVDADRVIVAGISTGAYLLGRIGAAAPGVAGLIGMSSPARSFEDIAIEQVKYLSGFDDAQAVAARAVLPMLEAIRERVQDPGLRPDSPASELMGAPGSFWLDLRGYDPVAAAAAVNVPILVLQGGRDYQVTIAHFEAWKAGLEGRGDCEFRLYPTLSHIFLVGSDPPRPADYLRPGAVAGEVIDDMAAWVLSIAPVSK